MSKQGTAGKRKHVTLMIPQKCQIIARLESGKAKKRLWLHTKVECQISMINRNGRRCYDHLWDQMKVEEPFQH
jgi:hypothetical protein